MVAVLDAPPALALSRITKRFGGVLALEDAAILVRPGTIHALLGENGAGKTTLMHIASGLVRPDTGRVCVAGQDVRLTSPRVALAAGIGMVHQHFTLVPAMTVAENLALGGSGLRHAREMAAQVLSVAKRTGFQLDPWARVQSLSVSAQQRVEIAKALVRDAKVLILDEPTAVLAPSEIDDLLRWLRAYADHGHAVVLITHKLREAFAVADDVTVLRHGRVTFADATAATSTERLTEAMIGTTATEVPQRLPAETFGTVTVFDAQDISVADRAGTVRIRHATFMVRAGEMIGIAAIEGSGHQELLRALAGRYVVLDGVLKRPVDVGFVPEDRERDAVMLDRSLAETVALRGAGSRRGLIAWPALRTRTTELMRAYDVRAQDSHTLVRALSGGNQQRLVLARELEATWDRPAPSALVVENPTRGLDVRATMAVHQRLRDACTRGAAVVVYSSDLDEVLSLATRVFVVFEGHVRDVPMERAAIGRAMLGLHAVGMSPHAAPDPPRGLRTTMAPR